MPDIIELPLPETVTDGWRDYQRLLRALNHELIGGPEWDVTDEASLASARAETEYEVTRYLAYVDGELAAYASRRVNRIDSPKAMNAYIFTLPQFRGRGIGRALADRLRAEADGYSIIRSWAECRIPKPGEPTLSPPSGAGVVPADAPSVKLALSYGLELGQVERVSRYDFAAPLVDPTEALAEAVAHAGDDYELIAWEGLAGDDMLTDLGILRQRMYSDPPSGTMTVIESEWGPERMRQADQERHMSNRIFRTVVRHRPSGSIVALNELMVERSNPDAFVDQWDTIVLPEHRGRRLGMLVKAANLIQVKEAVPTAKSIMTWNAEENRHMLAVNEALGFYPVLAEAAFELKVAEPSAS